MREAKNRVVLHVEAMETKLVLSTLSTAVAMHAAATPAAASNGAS